MIGSFVLLAAPLAAPPVGGRHEDRDDSCVVFAEKVYDPERGVIENGLVTVQGGRIASVAPGARGSNDGLSAYAVTPGMIDASVRIDGGFLSVEQSREVTPDIRIADAVDAFTIEWDRELRSGVTTVLLTPPDYNVIGGLGAVVKTGGPKAIRERIVAPDAVLRGAMGTQPSNRNHPAFGRPEDFYSRRPTTRMGVEWEWRKAFYDAAASAKDPKVSVRGSEQLLAVLRGELPLSIQAWTTQDIRTAVFLKEECEREGLGSPRLIIDAGAEAWREPELLVRTKTAVVLPPFPAGGRTEDNAFMAWNVAQLLHDKGVPIALSSHGGADPESRLGMQAGYAMRGGLSFDAALAAVTIEPARILGVEKRVGSLAAGKDADLVLWSGEPFQPTSRVVAVVLDGVVAFDSRKTTD